LPDEFWGKEVRPERCKQTILSRAVAIVAESIQEEKLQKSEAKKDETSYGGEGEKRKDWGGEKKARLRKITRLLSWNSLEIWGNSRAGGLLKKRQAIRRSRGGGRTTI